MTAAVCDDEKNIREHLSRLIKAQAVGCCVDLFESGDALLASQTEYDIYFLDIHMPGTNGMQAAEELRGRRRAKLGPGIIIFITALREHMSEAFDVNAFHYLVKPLDEKKFAAVFKRADEIRRREC